MSESATFIQFIADYGITGIAVLALLLQSYARVIQARKAGKTEEMETKKDLKTLELMTKIFDQAAERDSILTAITDRLEALTTTAAQTVDETQQTNRVLGNIMEELTKKEPEPTTSQKLDQLIQILTDLKIEVTALKEGLVGYAGRVETLETDVSTAQAAITKLADDVKRETQETPIVDEENKEKST